MILAKLVTHAVDLYQDPPRARRTRITTNRGKERWVHVPNKAMERLHHSLSHYVRRLHETHLADTLACVTCRPGSSFVENAEAHSDNRFFYGVDLVRAYHGVPLRELVKLLLRLDRRLCMQPGSSYRTREQEVYSFFRRYCEDWRQGGLMEGVPASPDLFNLYCAGAMDRRLQEIARRFQLAYTRYLDDLTFSSTQRIPDIAKQEIRAAITSAGFWVNHKPGKSWGADLARGQPVLITGIRLLWQGSDRPARLFMGQQYLRRLEKVLAFALRTDLATLPVSEQESLHARLRGLWQSYRQTTLRNRHRTTHDRRLIRNYRTYRSLHP